MKEEKEEIPEGGWGEEKGGDGFNIKYVKMLYEIWVCIDNF
jgi:hypothetical protein